MKLRGVRVHNLAGIDVTIPWGAWVGISGVSGSGKSSLAFDTLFAEGQRRYLDSLSPKARQFLEQLPQPEADHIDPLPPAMAVRQNARAFSPRATVGSASEMSHYLQLLFAKAGKIHCPGCQKPVRQDTPQRIVESVINTFPDGAKFQILIPVELADEEAENQTLLKDWIERGFTRAIGNHETCELNASSLKKWKSGEHCYLVVDRLVAGKTKQERIFDSLELAFGSNNGRCALLWEDENSQGQLFLLNEQTWRIEHFSDQWRCESCRKEFTAPEPRLFNPNSPLGACPNCEGQGSVLEFSLEQLVPNANLHLEEGALACFEEPPLASRKAEWHAAAKLAGIPLNLPITQFKPAQKTRLIEGHAETQFPGLLEMFSELQQQTQKPAVRAFVNRWLKTVPCPNCQGQQLQPHALAALLKETNIAEVLHFPLFDFQTWIDSLAAELSEDEKKLLSVVLSELHARTNALLELGLDALTLARPVSTLSTGEAQRLAIARTIGHQLVNSLYIVDEPSTGLHPADCDQVALVLKQLQQAENTLIVVEHEAAFLALADHLIDLGPGAGREGGQVVFEGTPSDISTEPHSRTGGFLSGTESVKRTGQPKTITPQMPRLILRGANLFPLKHLTVEFPLNCLCVLTGVSGSGKTVLLEQSLYPALRQEFGWPLPRDVRARFEILEGSDSLDEAVLLDQSPLVGNSRSNPATYLGVFDDIRRIFAEAPDAQRQGFAIKDFSFNSASGGRCPECAGQGTIGVEMQFLADLHMQCPECQGTRYKPEILTVRYRGLHIAEVLNLTAAEAVSFFRTYPRIRKRLQVLKDVGLDYLPLGQPTGTLSGGESQRLKLASYLTESTRAQTVFLMDEPTSGLHPADVQTLLDCFDQLLAVGHSVIVAEHNLHLIRQADWVIDLGPGAANRGGEIITQGPPEEVAKHQLSITGGYL